LVAETRCLRAAASSSGTLPRMVAWIIRRNAG
jgi:hypothetical protein